MPSDPYDTPAMRQYTRFKKRHPDCVLFFRMGDFYEMFGDDALAMHKALGLTVTQRTQGIPMAGVPHHQLETYLKRAIEHGFRVAVCEQVQDPREAKGVVERDVTRVVTPGTLVDETLLQEDAPSVLAAVAFDTDNHAGAAAIELSTGSFVLLDGSPQSLADDLARRGVRELVYADTATGGPLPRVQHILDRLELTGTPRPAWHFRRDEALEAVKAQFGVAGVEGFGLQADDPAVTAAGAAIRYLRETQGVAETPARNGESPARSLGHLRPPRREAPEDRCVIDAVSLRSLEIERTLRAGGTSAEGSLVGIFLASTTGPRCCFQTPMGKRLIREWLCRPLREASQIRGRQDAVATLVEDRRLGEQLEGALSGVQDVARIVARVALGRATPRDVVALGRSASRLGEIRDTIEGAPALAAQRERLAAARGKLDPLAAELRRMCVDEPPAHLREGGLIRDGVDGELDEARALQRDAGAWLGEYQRRLTEAHDLPNLKVGFNKVFGYFIELPRAQAARAPDAFSRKQTLKNAERYTTPELKAFEDKVTTAESRAIDRERDLFAELVASAADATPELGVFADAVAELDVLAGLASKAQRRGWVRPDVVDAPTLIIHGGRHPVLDELLEGRFVPNDVELSAPESPDERARATLALITGPNMAGKSTFIRQTALLVVLASVGSFIPADRATIGTCDRVFTRVGADDALHRGQSTFMVEMTETATILNNATSRSLVVLDEIGRGTSTLDGLSLAWAIAEDLAGSPARDAPPRTLFATHYHELTELEARGPGLVRNLHVTVREWGEEIVFLHQIAPGRADQSYGVHVARLAGVPPRVTVRAREILDSLSVQHGAPPVAPPPGDPRERARSRSDAQLDLFSRPEPHPAVDALREIKLESLSPLQAFDELRRLRALASGGSNTEPGE